VKIEGTCVVAIHYNLTSDDGQELDSSTDNEPLVYLHGTDSLIPGLERALVGRVVGDELRVTVQPEDGYGCVDPELIQIVPLDAFEGIDEVQPGMQFEAEDPQGQVQLITVQEVREEGVVVNGNHPLAGQVLHFDVKIAEVREATPEEIAHGHVH